MDPTFDFNGVLTGRFRDEFWTISGRFRNDFGSFGGRFACPERPDIIPESPRNRPKLVTKSSRQNPVKVKGWVHRLRALGGLRARATYDRGLTVKNANTFQNKYKHKLPTTAKN
jgi:hypothetical protein